MDARALLKEAYAFNHNLANMVLADVTPAVANSRPAGNIQRIAVIAAHMVQVEDMFLHSTILETGTIFEQQGWSEKTGIPPAGRMAADWGDRVDLNLDAFREYMTAVQKAVEYSIENLPDDVLNREITMGPPIGTVTGLQLLATLGTTHLVEHIGEIAALKGIQELKGLPF